MAQSLLAYTTANLGQESRGVEITIKKAENGFIFELEGSTEMPPVTGKGFREWESFHAIFVYEKLDAGLAEVHSFFEIIEQTLIKKVEKSVETAKKNGRGRPRKNGN